MSKKGKKEDVFAEDIRVEQDGDIRRLTNNLIRKINSGNQFFYQITSGSEDFYDKHCEKTPSDMLERLVAKEEIERRDAITSFRTEEMLDKIMKKSILENAAKIVTWLENSKFEKSKYYHRDFVCHYKLPNGQILGDGVQFQDDKSINYFKSNTAVIVLTRENTRGNSEHFRIKSMYLSDKQQNIMYDNLDLEKKKVDLTEALHQSDAYEKSGSYRKKQLNLGVELGTINLELIRLRKTLHKETNPQERIEIKTKIQDLKEQKDVLIKKLGEVDKKTKSFMSERDDAKKEKSELDNEISQVFSKLSELHYNCSLQPNIYSEDNIKRLGNVVTVLNSIRQTAFNLRPVHASSINFGASMKEGIMKQFKTIKKEGEQIEKILEKELSDYLEKNNLDNDNLDNSNIDDNNRDDNNIDNDDIDIDDL